MQISRFAAAALPAALVLAGCSGSSNNASTGIAPPVTTTPSAFPAEIAYIGNVPFQNVDAHPRRAAPNAADSPRVNGDNTVASVQTYSISGGSASGPTVTLLSQSNTNSDGTPEALTLDPAHRYLFVADNDDDQYLEVFQVNSDGSLPSTPVATFDLAGNQSFAHDNAEIAVAAPTGAPSNTEYVYVATAEAGVLDAFQFNTTTHTLTTFTPGVSSTDVPYSLATDTTGTHLYSGGGINHPVVTPYVINAANGTLTAETSQASGTSGPVLVVDDPTASAIFSYDLDVKYLYAYSTTGGTLTAGNYLQAGAGNGLAIAPNGSAVYLANGTNGTITSSVISGGSLGSPSTTASLGDTDLVGVAVDASSHYVLTLDQYSDSVVAFPITAPGSLGTPVAAPIGSSEPVSAVFVPVVG